MESTPYFFVGDLVSVEVAGAALQSPFVSFVGEDFGRDSSAVLLEAVVVVTVILVVLVAAVLEAVVLVLPVVVAVADCGLGER